MFYRSSWVKNSHTFTVTVVIYYGHKCTCRLEPKSSYILIIDKPNMQDMLYYEQAKNSLVKEAFCYRSIYNQLSFVDPWRALFRRL